LSCFFALTTRDRIYVVADNRRRIFGRPGEKAFDQAVLLDDARKIRRVSNSLWVAGTGLHEFLVRVVEEIRGSWISWAGREELFWKDLLAPRTWEERCRKIHREAVTECRRAWERTEAGSWDPGESRAEVLFASLSPDHAPVLIHGQSREDFVLSRQHGPGKVIVSSLSSTGNGFPDRELSAGLEWVAGELFKSDPLDEIRRAYDLLPPFLEFVSGILPREVSACGDLVVIRPGGYEWLLF